MNWEDKLAKANSLAAFKEDIRQHDDFEKRHVQKVDAAFEHFQQQLAMFWLSVLKILLKIS